MKKMNCPFRDGSIHGRKINCVTEMWDGCVISGHDNGRLCVWDIPHGGVYNYRVELEGAGNLGVNTLSPKCVIGLSDGHLVCGYSDGSIKVWGEDASAGSQ